MNLPTRIRNLALTRQIFDEEGLQAPRQVIELHQALMDRIVEQNKQGVDHYNKSQDE